MPMNQRTTWPPLGPGPAATGAGVMATTDGAALGAADALAATEALGATDGAALAQADATTARTPMPTASRRGLERERFMFGSPPLRAPGELTSRDQVGGVRAPCARASMVGAGLRDRCRGAGLAHDELRREDHAPRHGIRCVHCLEQEAGHLVAQLLDRLVD